MASFTCISCFYLIKNKHGDSFSNWLEKTLSINCPYVFFCNKEMIDIIKSYRKNLPTHFIEYNIEDFYTYKYKDFMITDDLHCPSVELNLVWNEKIFMLEKAQQLNPFGSEWFHWIDAGICTYRDVQPPDDLFPNIEKIVNLPKDKFIFSSSYPTADEGEHYIAGTSYLLHESTIKQFVEKYKIYLDKFVDDKNIWTDQIILTRIYLDNPDHFFKLCYGYGEVTRHLY